MPTPNPFPFNIPQKVNSPELLAFFQQRGEEEYLSAEEINTLVQAVNFLFENIGGGSLNISGITTLGTIAIDGDEVTFSGFAWKIAGVDYAQAAPITRTLPFASEGMYRTHTAYFTTTNDINIAVGAEDDEVTTEPNIPEGTLRMRAFNVFGEVITVGPGESLPYDINLLDLLLQNPAAGDYLLINVGGVDYRVDFQRLIDVLGGSSSTQNLDDVLNEGSTASITTDYEVEREGLFYGFGILITTEYPSGFFTNPAFYITDKASVVICLNFDVNGFARYDYGDNSNPTNYTDLLEMRFVDPVSGYYNRLARKSSLTQNFSGLFPDDEGGADKTIATREWTENLLEGLKTKQPVRLATTTNITLSGLAMIDGETPAEGDRVLVKDQTSGWLNGIYIATSGAWTRALDANTSSELINAVVTVLEGTANSQSTYRQINTSLVLDSGLVIWQTFGSSVPDATSSTKGKMKLFNDLLNSFTDGSVTQGAIVAALNLKASIKDTDPFNVYINQGLQYFFSRLNSSTFVENLRVNTLALNGNSSNSDRDTNIELSTTAVAGNISRVRGSIFVIPHISDWFYKVVFRFRSTSNVTDTRFAIGISNAYLLSDPTNVALNTNLNCIFLGKKESSNNLHIFHNDSSGLCTEIDLGSSYPFNNITTYFYTLTIEKQFGTTNSIVTVTRTDESGNSISVQNTLTSNLPIDISNLSPFSYITNNTTAAVASYKHYGCVTLNQRGIF